MKPIKILFAATLIATFVTGCASIQGDYSNVQPGNSPTAVELNTCQPRDIPTPPPRPPPPPEYTPVTGLITP